MGLISGMLMGIVFGIALMAGWQHMMRYRSNKRIAKAVDIKSLSSLNRDDLKKICGENFPEWISFPVFEQVKWLNKQLSKLWPFVADAAEAIIKDSVEPLLEEYRPPGITSMKFSKLSLGTVAPKIEGINLYSKSVKILYLLRMEEHLKKPRMISPILGGIPVDTSELELKPQGKIKITVLRANNLKNKELIGKSDPYAVVYIRPLFKVKTKVIENNLNPVWNQTFELIAEDKETQSLIIEVFDQDVGQDERLGIAKLPLIELEAGNSKEIELRLLPSLDMLKIKDKKDRGTLTIQVQPCD
ncbi:synaptotagmin-4-like [Olea europaea var. sylvestris]|uniref:synaptotagmin-4-like n=1 Tax=Olea europaea var. sylvestris TaxID=158386 RepID=UPI000C1D33FC|nr:synaptotagmin-4-like [Olea europaea var. sylvestris]